MSKNILPVLLIVMFLISGCWHWNEPFKMIWGSSTRALEEARVGAFKRAFECSAEECFDKVVMIAELEKLTVFLKDKKKGTIVLMEVKGSSRTTEVGVFFVQIWNNKTRLEVVSLSPIAQETAAKILFDNLSLLFKEIPAS